MRLPKIKVNSDMESTIVSGLMSQVDDIQNEIKYCEPKENEIEATDSSSKTQDRDQAPQPPPPPPPPPRSQSTTSLNVQQQLQQLKPIDPQLTIQDVQSSSKQKLKDLKPEIQDKDFQNSQSQVLDAQFQQNPTMQDFNQCQSHRHLNFDNSDLQFGMSLENQQQHQFQQQSFQQHPFQQQQFQQQPMQDHAMMSYGNHSAYYYQHQHQPLNPILRPETPYDVNFMSALPAFNTFGGGKNSINKIIQDLREMPWSDERLLCFLNVFHQFYNEPTSPPNGEHIIVFFKDKIPPLFKRSFIDYTTKGEFIIFYFYFCIKHFFAHNYML